MRTVVLTPDTVQLGAGFCENGSGLLLSEGWEAADFLGSAAISDFVRYEVLWTLTAFWEVTARIQVEIHLLPLLSGHKIYYCAMKTGAAYSPKVLLNTYQTTR